MSTTLVQELEQAATQIDCPVSPLCNGPCHRRELAARLRTRAQLIEEIPRLMAGASPELTAAILANIGDL